MDVFVHRPVGDSSSSSGSTYETSTNRRAAPSDVCLARLLRRCRGFASSCGDWWRFRASAGLLRRRATCGCSGRRRCGRRAPRYIQDEGCAGCDAEGLGWQNRALFHSLARGAPRRSKETAGQKSVQFQRHRLGHRPANENCASKPLDGPDLWKSARFCQGRAEFPRLRAASRRRARDCGEAAAPATVVKPRHPPAAAGASFAQGPSRGCGPRAAVRECAENQPKCVFGRKFGGRCAENRPECVFGRPVYAACRARYDWGRFLLFGETAGRRGAITFLARRSA